MSDGGSVAEFFGSLGLKSDERSWARGNQLIEGVKKGLEILAAYEGFEFLKGMIERTTEAAVGAEHLSQKLGVSTTSIQELGYAADVSGASAEDMQHALQHLSLGFVEAQKSGTGPLVDGLAALHVSLTSLKGLSNDERLMRIADGFADAGPEVDKTAVAMELFGKSGTALIPLLNRGADGIAELRKEAEELGVVIDEDAIKSFAELEENQKRLSAGLTGLRNSLVTALLPSLTKVTEKALEWFRANRAEIVAKLTASVLALGGAMVTVAEFIGRAIEVFGEMYDWIEKLDPEIDVFKTAMVAAGIAMAVAWVAALGPVGLMAVAIGALVLLGQDLYESIENNDGAFADLWATIKKNLSSEMLDDLDDIVKGFNLWKDSTIALFKVFEYGGGAALQVITHIKDVMSWLLDHAAAEKDLFSFGFGGIQRLLPNAAHVASPLTMFAGSSEDDHIEEEEKARARAAAYDPWAPQAAGPTVAPPVVNGGFGALTAPFQQSLGGGSTATSVSAPLTVQLTINAESALAGDIAGSFRNAFGSMLDEHVRNIVGAVGGVKK